MFKTEHDYTNKSQMSIEQAYDICGDWKDELPPSLVIPWKQHVIISDHHIPGGTKMRWGDLLFKRWAEAGVKEFVYVAPRQGFAAIAMTHLAKKYGVDITLFMPASREASDHQLLAIELGAKPIFYRIAAMPNLNRLAQAYAISNKGAAFIPFGLDHRLVTAAGIVATRQLSTTPTKEFGPPCAASVISTGVLTRTLQLAWPSIFCWHGVAVARNVHDGECGQADVESYHKPFTSPCAMSRKTLELPDDLESERCYDMKGLEAIRNETPMIFWNVAGNAPKPTLVPSDVDSYRDW